MIGRNRLGAYALNTLSKSGFVFLEIRRDHRVARRMRHFFMMHARRFRASPLRCRFSKSDRNAIDNAPTCIRILAFNQSFKIMTTVTAVPCPELERALSGAPMLGLSGKAHTPHSTVWPPYVDALYRLVVGLKPLNALEIGMACGSTTLAILTAFETDASNQQGTLISIDPMQHAEWGDGWDGVGALAVQRASLGKRHRLIEKKSYEALPDLLRQNNRFQFAYIDGWHTFDYTLLDFFYIDKMLDAGGIVGFNDCGWPSVHKVTRFVLSHRKYVEVEVELPRHIHRHRRIQRRRLVTRQDQDRYFKKIQEWEPDWDFFAPF